MLITDFKLRAGIETVAHSKSAFSAGSEDTNPSKLFINSAKRFTEPFSS